MSYFGEGYYEDNIDVSGGKWDSFDDVDGGYGEHLSQDEYNKLPSDQKAQYKARSDEEGNLYYDKSKLAAFSRGAKSVGSTVAATGLSVVADSNFQTAVSQPGASKRVVAATGVLPAVNTLTARSAAKSAQSPAPTLGGGCGLTYAGAAEIYAERMGMPLNGTTGGGGADDDAVAGGGCCGFVGGSELTLAAMRDYDKTINSVTKDKLVDDIISTLDRLGLKANGSSRSEKISAILGLIPNQKKNGKNFKADAEQQAKVCSAIAKVINDTYGRTVIDPDAEPRIVCQAVAEISGSLRGDIHMEFLVVHDETKRVLKNMLMLKTSLEQVYENINAKITNSQDTKLLAKSSTYLDLHKKIIEELTRQIVLMQNLIDVTLTPADVDISKLIEDSDAPDLIQKIESNPKVGTTQFGDVISSVLTNLGVTAGFALVIEKALKKVGISVDEYARSENLRIIAEKINKRLLDEDMTDDNLHEYLRSAELLYRNFYRAKDIAKVLNKSGGSSAKQHKMSYGGYSASYGGNYDHEVQGGECSAELDGEEWKTGLDRRVEDKKIAKNLIFRAFNKQINVQFDGILKSINILAEKIGSEIPITDQLEGFRIAVIKLKPLLNQRDSFIALTGYYNDARSKEIRETFLSQLRTINSFIEAIVEMSVYQSSSAYFRDIHARVGDLVKTIDQFSDRVAAKYGSGSRPSPVQGGSCHWMDNDEAIGGGDYTPADFDGYQGGYDDEDYEGGDDSVSGIDGGEDGVEGGYGGKSIPRMPSDNLARRTGANISDSITKFDYYYRIAQIKDNLKHSSKELDNYAENYTEIRADAIAKKIDHARAIRNKQLKDLDDPTISPYLNGKTAGTNADFVKQQKKLIKKFIEKQTAGVVNFWRTVEAVDEYMRVFTDGIAKNPQDVGDIKDMLDETEVIYDAYDEETGNELVRVFETFPNCMTGAGANTIADQIRTGNIVQVNENENKTYYSPSTFTKQLGSSNNDHYYARISAAGRPAGNLDFAQSVLPGNPYLVVMLQDGRGAGANVDSTGNFNGFKHIREMMGRFMILKNLLNIFIHIGNKFGGKELYRENFMKPTIIYKNLLEYLEISAFGMGLAVPTYELTYAPTEDGLWRVENSERSFSHVTDPVVTRSYLGSWWDTMVAMFGFAPGGPPPAPRAPPPAGRRPPAPRAPPPPGPGAPPPPGPGECIPPDDPRATDEIKAEFARLLADLGIEFDEGFANQLIDEAETVLRNMDPPPKTYGDVLIQFTDFLTRDSPAMRALVLAGGFNKIYFEGEYYGAIRYLADQMRGPDTDTRTRNLIRLLQVICAYGPAPKPVENDENNEDEAVEGGAFSSNSNKTYIQHGGNFSIRLGISAMDHSGGNAVGPQVKDRLQAMQEFGVYMRSIMPEFAGTECLQEVDQYFVRIIKSLCAKVLTTVGMYDVLKRPYETVSFDPVRMVIGAGSETPQVVDGAVELYFRLPMLAEFYRDLFSFNSGNNHRNGYVNYGNDLAKITMLPEADGLFSGLIKIVFRKGRNNKVGEFTDGELKEVIHEVNNIYSHMHSKYGDRVVMETIHEFVAEMNRRYGIVKKKDRDLYEEHFGPRYDYRDFKPGSDRPIDLPLLPGEEDEMDLDTPSVTVNPSLRYEKSAASEQKRKVSPFAIKYDAYKLFIEFRCMLDAYFRKKARAYGNPAQSARKSDPILDPMNQLKGGEVDTGSIATSFRPIIQSTQVLVKNTQNANEKFDLITKMIRGSLTFESADASKYLMFHETVVTGLNTLSAIHTILRKFQSITSVLDYSALSKIPGSNGWADSNAAAQAINRYYYSDNNYINNNDTDYIKPGDIISLYTFAPFAIQNNGRLMRTFIEQLNLISRDLGGLVEMRVTSSGISMNFSNLVSSIEQLFSSVKYFLDLLRVYIKDDPNPNNDLMVKYTDKLRPGSYYWLQEQLMEKIVQGREPSDTGKYRHGYIGLPQIQRKINSIFKTIQTTRNNGVGIQSLCWWGDAFCNNRHGPSAVSMTKPINKLLFKSNGTTFEANGDYSARYALLYNMDDNTFNGGGSIILSFNDLLAKYLAQFYDTSSEKIYKQAVEGFVSTFNQEIMNPSNGTNTILDMSNVSAGWAINNIIVAAAASAPKSIKLVDYPPVPAAARVPMNFSSKQLVVGGPWEPVSPVNSQIILESLAVMLKNIVSSRNASNQSYIYMLDNMAEVSLFMKEKYKANMPIFKVLFSELLRKAEFVRELLEKHQIPINNVTDNNGNKLADGAAASYISRVMSNVVRACMSMISCIDSVMREIADDPKYFEVRNGSIADYKNTYGKEPIAPISLLTLVLRNHNNVAEDKFATLPFDRQGTAQNKFKYGTRGILPKFGTKVTLDQLPGFKKIVDMFNMTVNSKFSVPTDKINDYLDNLTKLLKFVNEQQHYKGIFLPAFSNLINQFQIAGAPPAMNNRMNMSIVVNAGMTNATYSSLYAYDDSISIVESSDQDVNIADICTYLSGNTASNMDVPMRNIIDLNIVPINVNAMMRDIPLVNLYNYEWTFNRMVVDLIFSMSDTATANKIIQGLCAATLNPNPAPGGNDTIYPYDRLNYPKQESLKLDAWSRPNPPARAQSLFMVANEESMFASMLINPYREIIQNSGRGTANEYKLFHNLMAGRSMSGLSRPKFTSDQVYNKALLGQVYSDEDVKNTYPGTGKTPNRRSIFTVPKKNGHGSYVLSSADNELPGSRFLYNAIGQLRLDTVLVRNLLFITDSYRILRLKLRRDLMYSKDLIVNSHILTREDVTEFTLNNNKSRNW